MLRAHTSTRLLDNIGGQNQDGGRLSVAAIFFIVLATVALFVVGTLYICSYIRGRHRNSEQVRTKAIVIEVPDEAPTADEEMSTLEPIELASCEEKDVLDPESTLPDPSDIGRQHAALDVHYCTSACCDVCRQDVAYPGFLTVGQLSDTVQKDNKTVDDEEFEEPTKVNFETGINLANGSNYKDGKSMDDLTDKEDPKDDVSNSDSIKTKSSASGSNGEDGDISQASVSDYPTKRSGSNQYYKF